ncbi:hypothetical protein LEP1GSC090_0896 [Leptospira borgpetersenii serovar Javanica str. MK146]|nr:hypothetical protein LEP1GSC090_0896 [Leptospira borgpetersenii serovar Javanica str. MK146]
MNRFYQFLKISLFTTFLKNRNFVYGNEDCSKAPFFKRRALNKTLIEIASQPGFQNANSSQKINKPISVSDSNLVFYRIQIEIPSSFGFLV